MEININQKIPSMKLDSKFVCVFKIINVYRIERLKIVSDNKYIVLIHV